jgi:hypothetical protein
LAYSVEELLFGGEAIVQFYGNAVENPRKTQRTTGRERLRAEIVKTSDILHFEDKSAVIARMKGESREVDPANY